MKKLKKPYMIGNQHAAKHWKRDGHLNIRFNKELKARATMEAKRLDITLSDYVERAVRAKLFPIK